MKKIIQITFFTLIGLSLLGFLVFTIRQMLTVREVAAEWATAPASIPPLATTNKLEIIPLYEELSARDGLISGHGVSYLIRTDSSTILLDIGNNPENLPVAPFAQNMQSLGIEWQEVDRVVISHPHADHVGGVKAWQQNTIQFGELPGGLGNRLVLIPTNLKIQGGVHATIPTFVGLDVATTGVISYQEIFPPFHH